MPRKKIIQNVVKSHTEKSKETSPQQLQPNKSTPENKNLKFEQKDLLQFFIPPDSRYSHPQIPKRLFTRIVCLDNIIKAFTLKIKNWKITSCRFYTDKVNESIRYKAGQVKPQLREAYERHLKGYVPNCIRVGNKYFKRIHSSGEGKAWTKISQKHRVREVICESFYYPIKDKRRLPGITPRVRSLTLSGGYFYNLKLLFGIIRLYDLRELSLDIDFYEDAINYKAIPLLGKLKNLEALECRRLEKYLNISTFKRLQNLKKISLRNLLTTNSGKLLEHISMLPKLQYVETCLNYRNPESKLLFLENMSSLISLYISGLLYVPLKKADFKPFSRLINLVAFSFSSCTKGSQFALWALEYLPEDSKLEYLLLKIYAFSGMNNLAREINRMQRLRKFSFVIESSAKLQGFYQDLDKRFENLALRYDFANKISFPEGEAFQKFLQSQVSVKRLSLNIQNVRSEVMAVISASLPRLQSLERLEVDFWNFKKLTFPDLASFMDALPKISKLKELELFFLNNQIGDTELGKIFRSLRQFETLDSLVFHANCGSVPEEEFTEIVTEYVRTRDRNKIKFISINCENNTKTAQKKLNYYLEPRLGLSL